MRAKLVIVASVLAVALVAAVPSYAAAAQPAAPTLSPAPAPAVCPASSPAPSAGAQSPLALLPVPESAPFCTVYGACVTCSHTTAKPCVVTQCGTRKTYNCGDCSTDCVPPTI